MGRKRATGESNAELRQTDLKSVRLGGKPGIMAVRLYEAFQEVNLSPCTLDVDVRKLKQFNRFFEGLYERGACKTLDPRHFDESMVTEFMMWMKGRELAASTQEKYLQILERYLRLFGNDVIGIMRGNPRYRFPKSPRDTPIDAMDRDELQEVIDATYNLVGWSGWVFRGVVCLAFGIGGRHKEVIDAEVQDLSLASEDFYVRHPKGEGSWGVPQWVDIIRKDMLPYLQEFWDERERMLAETGVTSDFLFVNPRTGLPYSEKSMRAIKKKVEEISGVRFKIKDMRSTFCSLTINDHMERLNATSEQMRHASPDMTRKHYLRINRKRAIKNGIGDSWKETEIK
ncbi:MAG: site-specific integrase [Candidatus Methanomethylophilaceae archaeon]|nr:site-specific integrase [Candidatus Methanomethylophilaceae archaeon]